MQCGVVRVSPHAMQQIDKRYVACTIIQHVTSVYVYIHISIHIHNYIHQLTIINRGKGAGKIHSISEEISVLDQ